MENDKLDAIYAANDKFLTQGERAADYRAFLALLNDAPKVEKRDLVNANAKFMGYPSSAHFRSMTALMLVFQHQN